jgi:hypothetical protein
MTPRARALIAAALLACGAPAAANVADGTPRFSWTKPENAAPTAYRILCNGLEVQKVLAPTLEWQSKAGDFKPGDYSCQVLADMPAPAAPAASNVETFTIKPPVPPPVLAPVLTMAPNAEGLAVFDWTEPVIVPPATEVRGFCDGNNDTAKFKVPVANGHTYTAKPADFLVGEHRCYVLQFNGTRGPWSNIVTFSVVALPPVLTVD